MSVLRGFCLIHRQQSAEFPTAGKLSRAPTRGGGAAGGTTRRAANRAGNRSKAKANVRSSAPRTTTTRSRSREPRPRPEAGKASRSRKGAGAVAATNPFRRECCSVSSHRKRRVSDRRSTSAFYFVLAESYAVPSRLENGLGSSYPVHKHPGSNSPVQTVSIFRRGFG